MNWKLGDKVRLLPHADLWMRGVGNTEGNVILIGRKYITVYFPGWGVFKFLIDTDLLERA